MRLLFSITALALAAHANAQDLVAALKADPELSTLLGAISAVHGLAELLDSSENITIFAPTNSAFEQVDPASAAGKAIANHDVEGIRSVLSYHVAAATIASHTFTEVPLVVHTLLTPFNKIGGATATLVRPGQSIIAQVKDSKVVISSGNLATSTVTQADIIVGGATIHKIDRVFSIPTNASTTATAAGLTGITDALTKACLVEFIDTEPEITVFIPSNEAFHAIAGVVSSLSREHLVQVLQKHVTVGSVLYAAQIPAGKTDVRSALGEHNTVTNSHGVITINDAKVVLADVLLYNGVGHVIDKVLIPDGFSS